MKTHLHLLEHLLRVRFSREGLLQFWWSLSFEVCFLLDLRVKRLSDCFRTQALSGSEVKVVNYLCFQISPNKSF